MALHSADQRHIGVSPSGATMKNGGSIGLPLDTLGVFSKDARKTTKNGLKALSDFAGIDKKKEKLAILFGSRKDSGRHGGTKNIRTVDFSLSEIVAAGISHPKNAEQKFDYWRIGWDGVDANSTLKFHRGQTLEFQLTVGGIAATFFNNTDTYTIRQLINIPNLDFGYCEELGEPCEPVDCREHTIALVKNLNDYSLPGGQKLSQFYDIYPIFDTPTDNATPIGYTQYCLDYCGFGGEFELSNVSAQYPGVEVNRDTTTNKFVIFQRTDADAPEAYVETRGALLKGCDECPEGYDEIEGGVVYGVALEDGGEDLSETIQALPNAVADSAVKTGQDFGVGHYSVVLTKELTQAQEATFVTANPTSIIRFLGTREAFCANDFTATHEWVECGTCEASQVKFRILVPDDCNGTRLQEVRDAYPDLTITQVLNQNCVSVFETTVETDLSCSEGCNPAIVQQVFTGEAPRPFGINLYWYPVIPESSEEGSTLCGFEIKGKPIMMNPSEAVSDELPFILTSSRIIGLSGGYPVDYSMNSMVPENPSWRVLQLERAQDLDNLGGSPSLKEWEKKGRFYFNNELPYRSAVEREMTNSQSRLDNLTRYSDLYVEIEGSNKAGMNSKEYTYIRYHVMVPFGKTTEMEELFRDLAGAAGVAFEVK